MLFLGKLILIKNLPDIGSPLMVNLGESFVELIWRSLMLPISLWVPSPYLLVLCVKKRKKNSYWSQSMALLMMKIKRTSSLRFLSYVPGEIAP